ncbi:MAG: tetratricopeptide repeat protein [Sumerlaeia bacterium]
MTIGEGDPSPQSERAWQLIAEAIAKTAAGEREAAYALYREAADVDPESGIPALARFLTLTGQGEALDELFAALEESATTPTLRARSLAIAGRLDDAIALLRQAQPAGTDGLAAQSTALLARLLERRGEGSEAARLLQDALLETENLSAEQLLATPYMPLATAHANTLDPEPMTRAVGRALEAIAPDRLVAVEVIDPWIRAVMARDDYFEIRGGILSAARQAGPGGALLGTRLLMFEEDPQGAQEFLQPLAAKHRGARFWPVIAAERAVLLRSLGRAEEAQMFTLQAARAEQGVARARLLLDGARDAMAARDAAKALEILSEFPIGDLPGDEQVFAILVTLQAHARLEDLDGFTEFYAVHAAELNPEELLLIHDGVLDKIVESPFALEIEKAVRAQFAESPEDTEPKLWLLAAEAARRAGLKPNELEARYQYTRLKPEDTAALFQLGQESYALVMELATLDREILEVLPEGEQEKVTAMAEKALTALVRVMPFAPEPQEWLMDVYKATDRPDMAAKVHELVTAQSDNSSILGNAAYVLATNGFPEEAMKLYEKALERDPDNGQIAMNRAANLTRLKRWDEAIAFHKDLLEHGWKGKQWHNHDQVLRLWKYSAHLGQEEEIRQYFRTVITKVPEHFRETLYGDLTSNFTQEGQPEEAEFYLRKFLPVTENPSIRVDAWTEVAKSYQKAGQWERADELLVEALTTMDDYQQGRIDLTMARARIWADEGRIEESVEQLRKLAEKEGKAAALAYLIAGEIAEQQLNDRERAERFYRAFLDTKTTDFQLRRRVEANLSRLMEQTGPFLPRQEATATGEAQP